VDAAQAGLAAVRQDIALTAAEAYFEVLQAQRTVEVREAAVQSAQAQVRQAEAFFRAGTAAQADVIRARAAAARAEADLVTARGQVETTLVALRGAMALSLAQPVSVVDPTPPVVPAVAAADAVAEATRQRPEVLRADADIRSAEAALRIAEIRSGTQVNVNANASVQVTPDPGSAGWSISATVSHPLLDGGRSRAAVEEARANALAAAARRESTVLQVQTQAHQAAVSVTSTSARTEATRASSAAAEESSRVSEGRYRAGVGTLVELLDAQSSATEARIGAVQALYDQHLAVVNLSHALGRPLSAQR
jgi:outer membrane protein TolC